ncbi:hypothetical protein [Saccharopolyspora spinosa]|uniref:Uncharacterized protein n=1 Tax=Saccharopolyspora spinosa TaxID=60894 RepID=A0A2N3Y8S0_SACSN|nr:hypothetical protein [Saccharopolyspora spinosa]PKW19322.1 hypothetical protein A8926_7488 [Saccharopolyspora spinosa]
MTPLVNFPDPAAGTTSARPAVSCTDTELATHIRELEQAMWVSMMQQSTQHREHLRDLIPAQRHPAGEP